MKFSSDKRKLEIQVFNFELNGDVLQKQFAYLVFLHLLKIYPKIMIGHLFAGCFFVKKDFIFSSHFSDKAVITRLIRVRSLNSTEDLSFEFSSFAKKKKLREIQREEAAA